MLSTNPERDRTCAPTAALSSTSSSLSGRRLEDGRQSLLCPAMRRPPRDLSSVDANGSLIDEMEARDAPQKRRLSGSVRAYETGEGAGGDAQRDAVHCLDRTERLRDAREIARELFDSLRCERAETAPTRFRLPETRRGY